MSRPSSVPGSIVAGRTLCLPLALLMTVRPLLGFRARSATSESGLLGVQVFAVGDDQCEDAAREDGGPMFLVDVGRDGDEEGSFDRADIHPLDECAGTRVRVDLPWFADWSTYRPMTGIAIPVAQESRAEITAKLLPVRKPWRSTRTRVPAHSSSG